MSAACDLVTLKRELDEAEAQLRYAGAFNVHPSVPIHDRIVAEQASQRAQARFSDAFAAYQAALAKSRLYRWDIAPLPMHGEGDVM